MPLSYTASEACHRVGEVAMQLEKNHMALVLGVGVQTQGGIDGES
jgi:hypothetical protein